MTTHGLTMELVSNELSSSQVAEDRKLLGSFFPKGIRRITKFINALHSISPNLAASSTMLLFSISIRKRMSARNVAFYNRGRRISFQHGNMKYGAFEFGEGPVVLFVHGWMSNGARWRSYIDQLVEAGFKAVVLDAPAHGTSPGRFLSVPDFTLCVKNVLDQYGSIHGLVTHSMGSIVSTIAANMAYGPKNRMKLVLMNTFVDGDALISRFAKCIGIADGVMDYTKQWIACNTFEPIEFFSIPIHLKELSAETLYISDDQDRVVPATEVRRMLGMNLNIEFYKTSGLGHNLRSEKVIQKVLNHVVQET